MFPTVQDHSCSIARARRRMAHWIGEFTGNVGYVSTCRRTMSLASALFGRSTNQGWRMNAPRMPQTQAQAPEASSEVAKRRWRAGAGESRTSETGRGAAIDLRCQVSSPSPNGEKVDCPSDSPRLARGRFARDHAHIQHNVSPPPGLLIPGMQTRSSPEPLTLKHLGITLGLGITGNTDDIHADSHQRMGLVELHVLVRRCRSGRAGQTGYETNESNT